MLLAQLVLALALTLSYLPHVSRRVCMFVGSPAEGYELTAGTTLPPVLNLVGNIYLQIHPPHLLCVEKLSHPAL